MATKLSSAQFTLLSERQGRFINTYRPGLKLMEFGLIDAAATKSGGYYEWTINAAGEAFLAAQTAQEKAA